MIMLGISKWKPGGQTRIGKFPSQSERRSSTLGKIQPFIFQLIIPWVKNYVLNLEHKDLPCLTIVLIVETGRERGKGKTFKSSTRTLEKKIWDFLSKKQTIWISPLLLFREAHIKMHFSDVRDCFSLEHCFLCFSVHWVVVTISIDETAWLPESVPTWDCKTWIFRITSEMKLWKLSGTLKIISEIIKLPTQCLDHAWLSPATQSVFSWRDAVWIRPL